MIHGQEILNGLIAKRASLESERPKIDAEFQRIARKKEELEHRISSIDVVIKEFGGDILIEVKNSDDAITQNGSSDAEINFVLKPNENGHQPKKRVGLKNLAKLKFDELPHLYTKRDVVEVLRKANSELTKINENTLSGIMRYLVDEKLATIAQASSGTTQQIYSKV